MIFGLLLCCTELALYLCHIISVSKYIDNRFLLVVIVTLVSEVLLGNGLFLVAMVTMFSWCYGNHVFLLLLVTKHEFCFHGNGP